MPNQDTPWSFIYLIRVNRQIQMNRLVTSRMHQIPLIVILTAVAATATAQSAPSDTGASNFATGRRVSRAFGYYDPTLKRVMLVGGDSQLRPRVRDRAWSWSGTRWEPLTDSGPPARSNAGAAYDPRRRKAILTGGTARTANDSAYEITGDTWEGAPTGWQRFTGSDLKALDHQSMVYDENRGSVLLFGGIPGDRSTPWPSDTWELRGEGWIRIATEGPAGRGRSALVYDTKRRQVVLFGGVGAAPAPGQPQPFFDDTWVWKENGWRKMTASGPRGRYAHGMVFDEREGVVLLYSGAAAHRNAPLSDMWKWDGERWTQIPLTGPTPGHRYSPVMVYDRARGKTVLYGGDPEKDDTWEWDGRQWKEIRQ